MTPKIKIPDIGLKKAIGITAIAGGLAFGITNQNVQNAIESTVISARKSCAKFGCEENKQRELEKILTLKEKFKSPIFLNILGNLENQLNNNNITNEKILEIREQILYLKKISNLENKYQTNYFSKKTNEKILNIFNEIGKVFFIEDIKFRNIKLNELHEELSRTVELEMIKIKDNKNPISKNSYRDFIEEMISFKSTFYGTNIENEEISEFLEIFTAEYINLYESKTQNFNGYLDEKEVLNILENIKIRSKKSFDLEIEIELKDGSKKIFKMNSELNIGENGVIFSNDPKIAEIQKKYGINHITKSKRNEKGIFIYSVQNSRVKPFLEKTSKGSIQKKFLTENEVKRGLETGELVDLKNENKTYSIKSDIINSNETFASIETKYFLERIGKKFFETTGYLFQVTSLHRSEKKNKDTSGASRSSSHLSGNGVDFSFARVLDLKGNVKETNRNSYEIKKLEEILIEEDKLGNIILIEENDHFHISILSANYYLKNNSTSKLNLNNSKKLPIGEYLQKNSFPKSTDIIVNDIFNKAQIDYAKFDDKQKNIIYNNLINFLNYIVYIESTGGKFIENKYSSAKGPFQIIHGYKNGVRLDNYKEGYSTYEVWLRNYIKYTNNIKFPKENLPLTPEFVEKSLKSNGQIGPNELNEIQNINLFLVGHFLGDEKTNAESLMKILLLGDTEETRKFYFEKHHTDPDENTKILEQKVSKYFFPRFKKVI